MLESFGERLWIGDGPTVPFLGIPYPTRVVVAQLTNGDLWVWSPIALSDDLHRAVDALGPVRHLVAPNKIHHLFLQAWRDAWPQAQLHAAPGLAQRRRDLSFDAELGDTAPAAWSGEIDQAIFHGSWAMEEVVFFHRPSRTAIFADLIQRHDAANLSGWRAWLMRADGLVGAAGSTPREWRLTFFRRQPTRTALRRVLAWEPEQLIIAHGTCARSGARAVIARNLAWVGA